MQNHNRNKIGRFTRKRIVKRATVLSLFLLISIYFLLSFSPFSFLSSLPSWTATEKEDQTLEAQAMAREIITQKVRDLQNEVLVQLASCETRGTEEPDGAIILDTNNRMSIGRYQWQRESIQYYVQKFTGKDISKVEAIALAIDGEKATELTREVLFETKDGYKNWFNCSNKHNLKEQITLINRLSE